MCWFSVKMRTNLTEGDSALRAGIFKASGSIGPICVFFLGDADCASPLI
jgi:hypothetical protein